MRDAPQQSRNTQLDSQEVNTRRLRLESSPRIKTVALMSVSILQMLPGDLLWESTIQRQISLFKFYFFNFEGILKNGLRSGFVRVFRDCSTQHPSKLRPPFSGAQRLDIQHRSSSLDSDRSAQSAATHRSRRSAETFIRAA